MATSVHLNNIIAQIVVLNLLLTHYIVGVQPFQMWLIRNCFQLASQTQIDQIRTDNWIYIRVSMHFKRAILELDKLGHRSFYEFNLISKIISQDSGHPVKALFQLVESGLLLGFQPREHVNRCLRFIVFRKERQVLSIFG